MIGGLINNKNIIKDFTGKNFKYIIYGIVFLLHIIVLFTVNFNFEIKKKEFKDPTLFKIFDVTEYNKPADSNTMEVAKQEKISEDVIETDKQIKELDIDYLPMHLISVAPVFPEKILSSAIEYPPLALKQGIEGIVILELYIDKEGNIKNIEIKQDPGYGFAQAVIKAVKGIKCIPAQSNGLNVPVRFRKSFRFAIKK